MSPYKLLSILFNKFFIEINRKFSSKRGGYKKGISHTEAALEIFSRTILGGWDDSENGKVNQ